ncbi:MAG: diguanylate cyclase [bacterium]|nr:diguanylate cyclase [bacterium]
MDTSAGFFRDVVNSLSEGVYCLDRERRITYWNRGAELISGYSADEVIGRCCSDDILMHIDSSGNRLCPTELCPAAQVMCDACSREEQVFLHHKDGHRVPIITRVSPIKGNNGEVVGAVEVFSDNSATLETREQLERLRQAALLDPVTGVGNRRFGENGIRIKLDEMSRYGWGLGAIMLDIDRFKKVNDDHSHATGDRVLKMVANTLASNVRSFDLVSRWGGDEFLILLSNLNTEHLGVRCESLRTLIEHSTVTIDSLRVGVTVSLGAAMAHSGEDADSLVDRADQALLKVKRDGRNRVLVDLR